MPRTAPAIIHCSPEGTTSVQPSDTGSHEAGASFGRGYIGRSSTSGWRKEPAILVGSRFKSSDEVSSLLYAFSCGRTVDPDQFFRPMTVGSLNPGSPLPEGTARLPIKRRYLDAWLLRKAPLTLISPLLEQQNILFDNTNNLTQRRRRNQSIFSYLYISCDQLP
jgi:hypothetical protein